jgi:hypothetical protein
MVKEGIVTPETGSNPFDDELPERPLRFNAKQRIWIFFGSK